MKYSISQRNKIIHEVNDFTKTKKIIFDGINLFLNKHTLIPHPDTFELIPLAIEVIQKNNWIKTVADVGTGSGVIAVSLAKKFPAKTFFASDISKEALNIAKRNSVLNRTRNIHLSEYKSRNIDFIVSNPPFVGEKEFNHENFVQTHPEVKLEPAGAIVTRGDEYGLSPYLEIIKNSNKTNTKLYFFQCNSETIKSLAVEIQKIIRCEIDISKDTAEFERFLLISKM